MTLPQEVWSSYVATAANKLQRQLQKEITWRELGRDRIERMLRYGYVLRCLDEAIDAGAGRARRPDAGPAQVNGDAAPAEYAGRAGGRVGAVASAPGSDEAVDGGPGAPLRLLAREVPADWIDYNGHVTEFRYLELFGDATDALLRLIGVDAGYLDAGGSYYTVETHICHVGQLYAGFGVETATQVLGWDDKRLHVFHTIVRRGEDQPVATGEHMLVHVEAAAGRASPVHGGVRERLAALAEAHAALARPRRAGRRISL